ncbi:MAG: hypothetical protein EOP84_16655, partial [Verrucomicrobiaceae bacterium]
MPVDPSSQTRRPLPIILIRGFGGLGVEDEKRIAYQGFNDGTVYTQKQGENYIYEGMVLRFLKSGWRYEDATNVVNYFGKPQSQKPHIPRELLDAGFDEKFFFGGKVVIDPAMALALYKKELFADDASKSLWVFRYYDLDEPNFDAYGKALVRLIDFIAKMAEVHDEATGERTPAKVNIIAHSMGGLLVRHAVQRTIPNQGRRAKDLINKIVTLGTPHGGISFQIIKDWLPIRAEKELEAFNPDFQKAKYLDEPGDNGERVPNFDSYRWFGKFFPPERLLTVVGTNYRSYAIKPSSWLNRAFSVGGEFGPNYNRSDGLVKQTLAQIPAEVGPDEVGFEDSYAGAPRTFVDKCHGGWDSLVTARESFEIATRFFFGNVRARLRLIEGMITRGQDLFGKSEFYFGVSIKPRRVDFELFHQSKHAENCYGPFEQLDLSDPPDKLAFGWAGPGRLIWEGWLDSSRVQADPVTGQQDMVLRLEFYIGERDLFGIGFSDNLVYNKQYYVRALLPTDSKPLRLFLHDREDFAREGYDPDEELF